MSNWSRFVEQTGVSKDSGMVKCPCHNDSTASLSYRRKGDDVLLHCFASCGWRELRDAFGLTFTPNSVPAPKASPVPHRRIIREHTYRNYAGDAIAIKRRWGPDKYFDWVHKGMDGEWRPKLAEGTTQADLPLYRVVEAMEAARNNVLIFIVEGERDADTIHELGLIGICNPEGASGAASAYDMTRFHGIFPDGTSFCILIDNDDAGRKHSNRLASALAPTFTVSLLALPGLPEKEDVSWWVAHRRSQGIDDTETASELTRLAFHALPVLPCADVPQSSLTENDREAITERAAIMSVENGWPLGDATAIARHRVAERTRQLAASLTPAQRLAMETTDPTLRGIYADLAALMS